MIRAHGSFFLSYSHFIGFSSYDKVCPENGMSEFRSENLPISRSYGSYNSPKVSVKTDDSNQRYQFRKKVQLFAMPYKIYTFLENIISLSGVIGFH